MHLSAYVCNCTLGWLGGLGARRPPREPQSRDRGPLIPWGFASTQRATEPGSRPAYPVGLYVHPESHRAGIQARLSRGALRPPREPQSRDPGPLIPWGFTSTQRATEPGSRPAYPVGLCVHPESHRAGIQARLSRGALRPPREPQSRDPGPLIPWGFTSTQRATEPGSRPAYPVGLYVHPESHRAGTEVRLSREAFPGLVVL